MMPGRTRVKVCGITRTEDALALAALGVDALGFIFAEKSPRRVAAQQVRQITCQLPPLVNRVGVFLDVPVEQVVATLLAAGCNWVQLHGREDREYCRELRRRLPLLGILKAIRVSVESRPTDFADYEEVADGFVLDTYRQGAPGGTGQVFDWGLIAGLRLPLPYLLAGGIGPANCVEAVNQLSPLGLDINSVVETAPGVKDVNQVAELLHKLAGTWQQQGQQISGQ